MDQLSIEAARALAEAGALLLDIREDEEWDAGHAPDAVHISMRELGGRLDELPSDRVIVCVCRSGARSHQVARALEARGFEAHNLAGGMQEWEQAGHDVVTDSGGLGWVS